MQKCLIIESSGGSAHTTVAQAQKKDLISKGSYTEKDIAIIDITGVDPRASNLHQPWVPTIGIPNTGLQFFSGELNTRRWNETQKAGGMDSVAKLEYYIDHLTTAERIQSSSVYQHLKKYLEDNPDIKEIIVTQPLSLAEITRAVSKINQKKSDQKSPIQVKLIISEFLTEKTVHYLSPLSRVKKKHAGCLTVDVVNSPLRPEGETSESFHKRMRTDHIRFQEVAAPLRPEFLNANYGKDKTVYVKSMPDAKIEKGDLKEKDYLSSVLGENATFTSHDTYGEFEIKKKEGDRFITITLGSQGSMAMLDYIDAFIEQVLQCGEDNPSRAFLFITGGKNEGDLSSFYASIRLHIEKRMLELKKAGITFPDYAKIIPLSFQDDRHMSSLFQNSDVLITRTGGMSSIESNETQGLNDTRKVLLHSEMSPRNRVFPTGSFDTCTNELMQGTVRWEGGNAQFLTKSIGACLTSPRVVKYNLTSKHSSPSYQGSLTQLLNKNQLDKDHIDQITNQLLLGSTPHLRHCNNDPLLSFAKDIETVKCLIQHGAKWTPKIQALLLEKKVLTASQCHDMVELDAQIQEEIKEFNAPRDILKALMEAVRSGKVEQVQGILNLYPKLIPHCEYGEPLEKIAHSKGQFEVERIILLAKGYSELAVRMKDLSIRLSKEPSTTPSIQDKYQIYVHRYELNNTYENGKTVLTDCPHPDLRKMMVECGADPKYLPAETPHGEKQALVELFKEGKLKRDALVKKLKMVYQNASNEMEFKTNLQVHFPELINNKQFQGISSSMLYQFNNASTIKQSMPWYESLADAIKWIFGLDFMSKHIREEVKFLHRVVEETSESFTSPM